MSDSEPQAELLTGEEVRRILNIGKTRYWDLIWSGKLPSKKNGRRVYVTRAALDDYIRDMPSAENRARVRS
ncbi:unnamed protein product [Phaeothamnion confervicola]|jgi:excisionase family DNA binding protein